MSGYFFIYNSGAWGLPQSNRQPEKICACGPKGCGTCCTVGSYRLPTGLSISNIQGWSWYLKADNVSSNQFPDHKTPILEVSMIYSDAGLAPYKATECILFWCVNTYVTSNNGSSSEERVIQSWYNNGNISSDPWDDAHDTDSYTLTPNYRSNTTLLNTTFTVEPYSHAALIRYLSPLFSGSFAIASDHSVFKTGSADVATALYDARGDIPALFTKLASRLTGAIRSKPQSEIYSSLPTSTGHSPPSLVTDTAWTNETYISVRWQWLAHPIALEALTALFLVVTI